MMKHIQSVERALKLLELLDGAVAPDGIGVQELSRMAGLKLPTAHNFLQTLIALGYVRQQENSSKYALTEKVKFLGWRGGARQRLIEISRPYAETLAGELNEMVTMVVLQGNLWLTLFRFESSQALSVRENLPMTSNFYISATGRCILSSLSERELESLIRTNGLPSAADWEAAADRRKLEQELNRIREQGYEIYSREDGVTGVGVSVFSAHFQLHGAIGVALPETRFQGEHRVQVINKLRQAAERIIQRLNREH